VRETRWLTAQLVPDDNQGVWLSTMKKLADYWVSRHDRRKAEANLNQDPQLKTSIDRVDIHFIHVRSAHADTMPTRIVGASNLL
jgi:hypothetical protein